MESRDNTDPAGTMPPEKNSRSANIFFVVILGCWLLLLYFYGGAKGPG